MSLRFMTAPRTRSWFPDDDHAKLGLCCGQPATAQSESLRVEHHPQPTLTRTASLSLGDTPTRPLTPARNGGGAEQAYGGRETPERVPTGVPLESLEGTQG